jgi:glycosyltransferase involved in cell wall biosynthesis
MAKPSRPRILLVTHVSAFSSASGSEQRSTLMRKALQTCGDVDVLELKPGTSTRISRSDKEGVTCVLASTELGNGGLTRYRPKALLTRRIEESLGRSLSEYRLIVGRHVWGICQLQVPPDVKLIADLDDFHYRYAHTAPWNWVSLKERLLKFAAHHLLRMQLHRFDGAFVLSGQDRDELARVHKIPTAFVPNVAFSSEVAPTTLPGNKQVLFVGSLWYRPNVEGVNWFLQEVWPTVQAQVPGVQLMLAGAAPPHVRTAWETHSHVSAPGFVQDLAATYRDAQLVIVPLHTGGGTNIKVLEALAHSRLCLATGFVVNAFDHHLAGERELLTAEDAQSFIQQTVRALQPDAALQAIASRGYEALNTHFGLAMFDERVIAFANTLLNLPGSLL